MVLAWIGGGDSDEKAKYPTIVLAVLAIYVTDFAINAGLFPYNLFSRSSADAYWDSHVVFDELDSRYSSHRQAADRHSMV